MTVFTRWQKAKNKSEAISRFVTLMGPKYAMCGALAVGRKIAKGFEYVRLRCKRWGCPRCGPYKAKKLRHSIAYAIEVYELSHFLTLTVDAGDGRNLPKLWSKFLDRVKPKYGHRPEYIWVFGVHESGRYHLHVLLNTFIDPAWGAKAWRDVGGGANLSRNFHIREVQDSWASDYITKDILRADVKRRYGTSKGIKLGMRESTGEGWLRSRYSFKQVYESNGDRLLWEKLDDFDVVNHFAVHDPDPEPKPG